MRARHALLLVIVALTATAFTTTPAAAENESVTVLPEPATCGTVSVVNHLVSGGCTFHITGELDLLGYPFGMNFPIQGSSCISEYTGNIGGNGNGFTSSATLADHAPVNDCLRRPCTEENEGASNFKPWPVSIHEEAGVEYLVAEFCFWNPDNMNDQRCSAEIPLDSAGHSYSFTGANLETTVHTAGTLPFGCGIGGHAEIEGTALELVH